MPYNFFNHNGAEGPVLLSAALAQAYAALVTEFKSF